MNMHNALRNHSLIFDKILILGSFQSNRFIFKHAVALQFLLFNEENSRKPGEKSRTIYTFLAVQSRQIGTQGETNCLVSTPAFVAPNLSGSLDFIARSTIHRVSFQGS